MGDVDPGLAGLVWTVVLVAARLVPLAVIVPAFGGALVPLPAQLGIAATVALAVAGALPVEVAAEVAALPPLTLLGVAVKEVLVGAVIALLAAVPLYAAEIAGHLVDVVRGTPDGGEHTSPTGAATTPLGVLGGLLGVVVFVGVGGHLLAIRAVAESYAVLPLVDVGPPPVGLGSHVLAAITGLLGVAVGLAAPALVAAVIVEIALALVVRAGGVAAASWPVAAVRSTLLLVVAAAALVAIGLAIGGHTRAVLDGVVGVLGP